MADPMTPLLRDFLRWIDTGPKPYAEVMEAWRTSCPRLTVWEDALDRGLVARAHSGRQPHVEITPAGRSFLNTPETAAPAPAG